MVRLSRFPRITKLVENLKKIQTLSIKFLYFLQFRNNIHFDAIFISMINLFTAVYAGFAVFGILGFMAKRADLPISEVVSQGPGLSFITYPEVRFLHYFKNDFLSP